MNNRIKALRKELGLSQRKFGEILGVTDVAISRLEKGDRSLTKQMFISICREFKINEEWLRTGIGEMFNYSKEDTLLDKALSEYKLDDFQKNLVKEYLSLSLEQKNAVKSFLNKICNDSVFNNNEDVKNSKYADVPTEQLLQDTEERETELAKRDLSAFQKQDETEELA